MTALATEYEPPRLAVDPSSDHVVDDEWAVAGAVAAVLGVPVAVVAYICSVCDARSFDACVQAVQDYFGDGC